MTDDTLKSLLERPPRTMNRFLAENAAAFRLSAAKAD